MITKFLEIRDRGTLIPALAIEISKYDHRLAWRAGFGEQRSILLLNLAKMTMQHDPYEWNPREGRTMKIAHQFIRERWDVITESDVIDVEYILSETISKKTPEVK